MLSRTSRGVSMSRQLKLRLPLGMQRFIATGTPYLDIVKRITEDHSPALDRPKGSTPTERPGEPE